MNDTPATFWAQVRTTFLRGAAVIIPVVLTFWFFQALLNALDGILSPILENALGRHIPGLGFISMLMIVFVAGLLSRNLVGRIMMAWFENLLRAIPFVRSVYGAVKDLVGAFSLEGKGKTFREVVLIEYPRPGLYSVAFVTNQLPFIGLGDVRRDFVNVYIPNPPNPTSGVLILVPREDIIHLELSVEQGLKLSLSGGIVIPDRLIQRQATS